MKKYILNLINNHIKQLEYIGGLVGWALVKKNGILIKSKLPREINDKIFGAMSATIFEGIDTAIQSLNYEQEDKQTGTDSLSNITIELDDSQVVMMSVTEEIIIVVALQLEVNLGLILIELEEIIKIVNEIISESAN
mgnify:CR=1 FL=1